MLLRSEAALEAEADTVIILENDLYRRLPAPVVDKFLARFQHVVALDHLETATTAKAELVLPVATFAEGDGTLVSSEGRAQRSSRYSCRTNRTGKLALAGIVGDAG